MDALLDALLLKAHVYQISKHFLGERSYFPKVMTILDEVMSLIINVMPRDNKHMWNNYKLGYPLLKKALCSMTAIKCTTFSLYN